MAASAPLVIRSLYDVDKTLLNDRGQLNESLIVFMQNLQYFLSEEDAGIVFKQHLFTARDYVKTLEYAYSDICENGILPTECFSLLSNLVAELRDEYEIDLDDDLPVIQGGDALAGCELGEFFLEIQTAFEAKLLRSDAKVIRDMQAHVVERCAARLDPFMMFSFDATAAWMAVPAEHKANMEILLTCCEEQQKLNSQLAAEGLRYEDKCALLAKVLERFVDENAIFLWIDDKADLYTLALNEHSIKVRGRPLSEVVKERVLFIQEDLTDRPISAYYKKFLVALKHLTHPHAERLKALCARARADALFNESGSYTSASDDESAGAGAGGGVTTFAPSISTDGKSQASLRLTEVAPS